MAVSSSLGKASPSMQRSSGEHGGNKVSPLLCEEESSGEEKKKGGTADLCLCGPQTPSSLE